MLVSVGSKGPDATRVQTLINRLGYRPQLVVDGDIGPASAAGIKWAQRLLGVAQDGQWGPATDGAAMRRLHPVTVTPPPGGDVNVRATSWLGKYLGPKEQYGANDGPWLRAEENKVGDDWMWKGHNPYCAEVGARVAYQEVGVDLHHEFPTVNWAYCPSIDDAIGRKLRSSKWKLQPVSIGNVRYGDILLFQWPGSNVADHFGHATSPVVQLPSGAFVHTVEANTPPGDSGSQSGLGGGDGIWPRLRSTSVVRAAGRLVPA